MLAEHVTDFFRGTVSLYRVRLVITQWVRVLHSLHHANWFLDVFKTGLLEYIIHALLVYVDMFFVFFVALRGENLCSSEKKAK